MHFLVHAGARSSGLLSCLPSCPRQDPEGRPAHPRHMHSCMLTRQDRCKQEAACIKSELLYYHKSWESMWTKLKLKKKKLARGVLDRHLPAISLFSLPVLQIVPKISSTSHNSRLWLPQISPSDFLSSAVCSHLLQGKQEFEEAPVGD